jgi:oligopeptide transport system substrate-binding protein
MNNYIHIKNYLPLLLMISMILLYSPISFAETVIHRGNGTEPETLDIHKSSGVPEANIQRDLFEGLITEAADGTLIAGVAERWEQDKTGKKWTFYLRKELKWSDGHALSAQDFVTAMQRAVNPKTASEYAFILWPILNAEAISKGENTQLSDLGVKAIDAQTLEIHLENPTAYLTGLLAHHMAYPIPTHIMAKDAKHWARAKTMVSNGAYTLQEWLPQSHITLRKNPHYREQAKVAVDSIIYYPSEDKGTELKRFRAGELDITEDIPSDQLAWIMANLGENFHNSAYMGTYYIALNLAKAPFKDQAKLRLALNLAIDRQILTEKITKSGEIPAWGWVPQGVSHYSTQTMQYSDLDKKARQALAVKLFAEAGYSKQKPLEVEFLYNTSDNHKKVAIALAAMWKQVLGVKLNLRNEEWKVYLNSRSQGQFEMIRAGWIGDYNDAYSFLSLFRSDVGTMNPSNYKNSAFDALVKQSEREVDSKKRIDLLQQAETILLQDLPLIPLYYYTTQHLVHKNIVGWHDNVMDIHPSRYLSKKKP